MLRNAVCFSLLWLGIACGVPLLLSQDSGVPDLYKIRGQVIAEGRNNDPVGDLKLKTYRIEEVILSKPVTVEIDGKTLEVSRAYRVTITGGPFPVRALPGLIWIDDDPLKYAQESEDLSEVTAVTFDRMLLRDGATIAFSFDEEPDSRTRLPEKLQLRQ